MFKTSEAGKRQSDWEKALGKKEREDTEARKETGQPTNRIRRDPSFQSVRQGKRDWAAIQKNTSDGASNRADQHSPVRRNEDVRGADGGTGRAIGGAEDEE